MNFEFRMVSMLVLSIKLGLNKPMIIMMMTEETQCVFGFLFICYNQAIITFHNGYGISIILSSVPFELNIEHYNKTIEFDIWNVFIPGIRIHSIDENICALYMKVKHFQNMEHKIQLLKSIIRYFNENLFSFCEFKIL